MSQANKTQKLSSEALSGLLLLASAVLALVAANSPWSKLYDGLLEVPAAVAIGTLGLEKPLLLWINDGLMAAFFLMIGLEVKREMTDGALATWSQRALPLVAAVGGMRCRPAFSSRSTTAIPQRSTAGPCRSPPTSPSPSASSP